MLPSHIDVQSAFRAQMLKVPGAAPGTFDLQPRNKRYVYVARHYQLPAEHLCRKKLDKNCTRTCLYKNKFFLSQFCNLGIELRSFARKPTIRDKHGKTGFPAGNPIRGGDATCDNRPDFLADQFPRSQNRVRLRWRKLGLIADRAR